ncbi:hypothetical protein [Flavihumibacter sp. UBA7668]|uniref:hypothetical protein n=1 Tax=Flavihumibacter sp. UBA7668 TaxID=1946542 RepID=UPI0025BE542F|nr:hypothetical protein [Flavihumibacter sp. UBA7668]
MNSLNPKTPFLRVFLLIHIIFFHQLTQAQSGHKTCAPGCEYIQNSPGTVSCIDAICSICHEKQKKEREQKKQQEKIAAQKRVQQEQQRKMERAKAVEEQKKQVAIQRQKTRENELVLVAPGSSGKTSSGPDRIVKTIDAKDREIMELAKTQSIQARYFSGKEFYNGEWVEFPSPICHIYYNQGDQEIILKKIIPKTNLDIYVMRIIPLNDTHYFTISIQTNSNQTILDLMDLSGEMLLKDERITSLDYVGDNFYQIGKNMQQESGTDYYEMFNIASSKHYPFPDGLVNNWAFYFHGKKPVVYAPYNECILAGSSSNVRKKPAINLICTWNMKQFRKNGYQFYSDYKIGTGSSKGESLKSQTHGIPPQAFQDNKDNMLLMFAAFNKIEPGKYDDSRNQIANEIAVYGFLPGTGKYILIDAIPFKRNVTSYHILTGFWFGQMK